ncbi:MAG: 4-carboxymuconolactone decarboxylase [Planctomycetes bacterium]|nr:4-carboxymuconolactone decarboxylase [Planctomycetota bacterium]
MGELREQAEKVMATIFGDGVEGDQMIARKIAPEFFDLAGSFCFGGFWSRPQLEIKNRSLVTVSQLAALGRTDELKLHLQGAINVGWTREEILEVLMQTSQYAGIPAAVQALNAAAEIFGED